MIHLLLLTNWVRWEGADGHPEGPGKDSDSHLSGFASNIVTGVWNWKLVNGGIGFVGSKLNSVTAISLLLLLLYYYLQPILMYNRMITLWMQIWWDELESSELFDQRMKKIRWPNATRLELSAEVHQRIWGTFDRLRNCNILYKLNIITRWSGILLAIGQH